jgi:citrate lyase subunit beta/citryl-CoA lyase
MMFLRSMLFVPGNNPKMIPKVISLPADGIIFDLEDAVPLAEKEKARNLVKNALESGKTGKYKTFVRINDLTTGFALEDLNHIVSDCLDGVLLAKAESRDDIFKLDNMLQQIEHAKKIAVNTVTIIPLLETAKGIINAYEIASANKRIVATSFGAGDYYRDMGRSTAFITPEQTELLFARSQVAIASRAAGVQSIDTVFFGLLTDLDGFRKEATLALRLGFQGKLLIHPRQIDIANEIFSPSKDEITQARKVVKKFEDAQSKGLGAVSLEGKMIDYMTYRQAKALIDLANSI